MRHFRLHHIGPATPIAIVPEHGYQRKSRQSVKALKFLKWMAFRYEMRIQHRDSPGGEKRYRQYLLDGYVQREPEERDLCIEFNGCAWHGHECLYTEPDTLCPNGKTAAMNRFNNDIRRKAIEQEMDYEVHWECEVDEQLRRDEEMRRFFDRQLDIGPLVPRDAFFGGVTGPRAMKCDLEEAQHLLDAGYEIFVYDVNSLYPSVNYYAEYPLGHPSESKEINKEVNWTQSADNPYKGLIKCFVVPPDNLLLPVIPQKYNDKLMFVLCNACARDSERRSKRQSKAAGEFLPQTLCPHRKDELRGFIATLTHLELNLALDRGYRVTYLYAVDVWEKWTTDLFRPYVQKFMKLKVDASGWPDGMEEDEEKQRAYVEDYERRFGIQLDASNVRTNPGMKYIAKLCLNSLWGKWAMRNDFNKSINTHDPEKLYDILDNPRFNIGSIRYLGPDFYRITYGDKAEFVEAHSKHNIVLSLFTTSAARVKLYHYMEAIVKSPHCKLLYTGKYAFPLDGFCGSTRLPLYGSIRLPVSILTRSSSSASGESCQYLWATSSAT
jgi:hypothetical protein